MVKQGLLTTVRDRYRASSRKDKLRLLPEHLQSEHHSFGPSCFSDTTQEGE